MPALPPGLAVSVGNPHCVFIMSGSDVIDVASIGPVIEHHPLFPQRTNVEFVTVVNRSHVRVKVWERGAGITMACGTGACAVAVACIIRGVTDNKVGVCIGVSDG